MKIALFHNLPSGGAKRHTLEQLKELSSRGHRIVEYAPSTADNNFCPFAPFVTDQKIYDAPQLILSQKRVPFLTPYLHAGQIVSHLERTKSLNREIAEDIDAGGYDIVLVKDCQIVFNPYVLRFLSTKSVFQCHHGARQTLERKAMQRSDSDSVGSLVKTAYYYPARVLINRHFDYEERANILSATKVLTNSRFSEGVLADLYGINAMKIYPGIDTQVFRPQQSSEGNYVLSVGALIYSKGHRFLVSALALIDPRIRPHLFIAANARDPHEERIVREMAKSSNVKLHIETITDTERLVDVYNQAKVFVYAPLQEALGMAPLEAMACGTPVTAVAEGGVLETVVDGETGWLADRDPSSFAEKLTTLLIDQPFRHQMGDQGIEFVRTRWTWKSAVDTLEDELLNIATERHHAEDR